MTTESNAGWWKRREAAVALGVGSVHQRFVTAGDNAELTDVEGNRLIDFATGIAVCNTGHSNARIVAAVKRQLDAFSHASFQVTPYPVYVELAEKLNAIAPGPSPKKSLLVTTGAEAVENAVKIARAHTGRHGIIALRGGYHGRTMLTMAMTGKVAPYKARFGPMPGGVFHATFPNDFLQVSEDAAIRSIEDLFIADIAAVDVAAIIVEPVLGEGGFYVLAPAYMRALRRLCDAHGILLIADEIQTGFARTGQMFAIEHSGVEPDLMTIAKAMAGGFPIAGVIGKAAIMDAPGPGGLGGTYGGSPLGCAAALEVLRIIAEDDLCGRADLIGAQIRSRLESLRADGVRALGDIRGLGAMIAVELVVDGDPARPDPDLTRAIVAKAGEAGLILLPCGMRGNVIRFLPALTAPEDVIAEGLDILEGAIRALAARVPVTA